MHGRSSNPGQRVMESVRKPGGSICEEASGDRVSELVVLGPADAVDEEVSQEIPSEHRRGQGAGPDPDRAARPTP